MTALGPVKSHLRFVRIDSASAAMTFVLLGYLLTGQPFLSLGSVQWLLFGLLYHLSGFADNSIQDFGADVADENKRAFPLGKEVSLSRAKTMRTVLVVLTAVLFLAIARSAVALGILAASVVAGTLYNRFSKRAILSPVLYAVSFGSLAMVSYYATASKVTVPILLVTAVGLSECLFQNSVSTSLKDVGADRTNIMRRLGAKVEAGRLEVPARAKVFAYTVRSLSIIPVLLLLPSASFLSTVITALLATLALLFSVPLVKNRSWVDRPRLMLMAACSQLAMFYAVLAIFAFRLEPLSVVFVALFPIGWYATVKKAIWGSVSGLYA